MGSIDTQKYPVKSNVKRKIHQNTKSTYIILVWPKRLLGFSVRWLLEHLVVFNFIWNNSVRLYCDSCHINMHFLKNIKIGEFLYRHFNIEDGRKWATFSAIMLCDFKKGKKHNWNTYTAQIFCAGDLCSVWAVTDWMCQKWLAKFCAGDFSLDDAQGQVDLLRLIEIKSTY